MPTISVSKPQARVQKARERLVGLLRQDQRKGDVPTCFISRDEAQYLWKCGFAAWVADSTLKVNKCKPLKLHDTLAVHPGLAAMERSLRPVYLHEVRRAFA